MEIRLYQESMEITAENAKEKRALTKTLETMVEAFEVKLICWPLNYRIYVTIPKGIKRQAHFSTEEEKDEGGA